MDIREEFCLSVQSEMTPIQDVFETVSDPIPKGQELHLLSVDVACSPRDEDGNQNVLRVDLLWREVVGGESFDHPVDAPVWAEIYQTRKFDLSKCLDGTKMLGDGTSRLVVRRAVEGEVGSQSTAVVVRGHCHP
jgi:hypothetical protein